MLDLVAVSLGCPFESQVVSLSWDDVGAIVSEPDRRRQTSTPVPFLARNGFTDGKDLPIPFEPQTKLLEPRLHPVDRPVKLALVRSESGHVVHVPYIMLDAEVLLPQRVVERLQDGVGVPLRGVRADEDAVFDGRLDQTEDAVVLDKLAHTIHDHFGRQAVVKVVNITLIAILSPFLIAFDPFLDGLSRKIGTPAANTSATIRVHPAHKDRLDCLDQSMMDILVWPLTRLVNIPPLLRARVIPPDMPGLGLYEARLEDTLQILDALLLGLLDPKRAAIDVMLFVPMMRAVDLFDRPPEIFLRDNGGP